MLYRILTWLPWTKAHKDHKRKIAKANEIFAKLVEFNDGFEMLIPIPQELQGMISEQIIKDFHAEVNNKWMNSVDRALLYGTSDIKPIGFVNSLEGK